MSPTCSKAELARKPKGLSKGAACVTCKLRKVRCDAVKPACTACRRSARWRGQDDEAVACRYVEPTPRRKASNSHHDDLLRQRFRSGSGDSTASSNGSTPRSDSAEDLLSSPPSPAPFDLESLFAFPIPSFPAVTAPSPSASSSFVLPQLPSLDNGCGDDFATPPASVPISAQWATLEGAADAGYDSRESLVRDLAASMSGPPQWMSPLESSGFFLAGNEAALLGGPAPQFASGLVASPASYLDFSLELGLAPCPAISPVVGSSSAAFPALASPSGPAPAFDLPCPVAPCPPFSSSSCSSPSRRTAPPTHIDLPASDPADPFAAAFGRALAERLCAGASQLSL